MTEEEDKKAWKDFTENGRNLKDHFGKIKKEAQNKKDYIKPKKKMVKNLTVWFTESIRRQSNCHRRCRWCWLYNEQKK